MSAPIKLGYSGGHPPDVRRPPTGLAQLAGTAAVFCPTLGALLRVLFGPSTAVAVLILAGIVLLACTALAAAAAWITGSPVRPLGRLLMWGIGAHALMLVASALVPFGRPAF